MNIPEFIRRKKQERGVSDEELAQATGLDLDSIYDLELHENDFELFGLPKLMKLCAALSVSIADIYRVAAGDLWEKSLAEIIRARREEKELSVKELAVMIGFDVQVVEVLENGGDLNLVCIEAFKLLAYALDLPLVPLLEKLEADQGRYRA